MPMGLDAAAAGPQPAMPTTNAPIMRFTRGVIVFLYRASCIRLCHSATLPSSDDWGAAPAGPITSHQYDGCDLAAVPQDTATARFCPRGRPRQQRPAAAGAGQGAGPPG